MSFRDVRALTEHLRSLGYPSVISLESFRTPNFDLVADLLAWLVKSYDPHADIPLTIGSEDERVAFITSVAEFLAVRAQVKLNPRKLYMADGSAVRELLKLIDLFASANDALAADADPADAALVKIGGGFMYHHGTGAAGTSNSGANGSADARHRKSVGGGGMIGTAPLPSSAVVGDLSTKSATIRAARDLASDLTNRGATLYDMLATETQSRAARTAALSKAIDLPSLRTAAQAALAAAQTEVTNLSQTVATMSSDATALAAKIEKKTTELERRNKRLKSMQGVRPAYMDEFERVEGELKGVYEKYVRAVRNLAWLESLVEESLRVEMDENEEAEMSLKRLQQRIKQEELNMLRGDVDGLLGAGGDASDIMYQDQEDDVDDDDDGDDLDADSEDSFARDEDGDDDFGPNSTGMGRDFETSDGLGGSPPKSAMLRDDEFMDALIMGRGSNVGKSGTKRAKGGKRSKNPQGYGGLDSDLDGDSDDDGLGQAGEDHAQLNERLSQILRESDPPVRDRSGATRSKPSRTSQQHSSNLSMSSRNQLSADRLMDSEGDDDDSDEDDEDPELDDDLVAGGQYVPKKKKHRGNAKKAGQSRTGGAQSGAATALVDDDDDEALLSGIVDYGDDGAADSDEDQVGGAGMDESDNDF